MLNTSVQKIDSVKTDCSSYINNINIKTTTTSVQSFDKKLHEPGKTGNEPINPLLIWPNELSGDAR